MTERSPPNAMDAVSYLRRFAEDRLRWLAGLRADLRQEAGSDVLRDIQIAAAAAIAVGALDRSAAERIVQDLRINLVNHGIVAEDTIALGPLGDQRPVGPSAWGDLLKHAHPPSLVRVIPVAKEFRDPGQGAGRIVVISLEVWTDHATLRFALYAPLDAGTTRPPDWSWTISDDVGTVFSPHGGGGGGHDGTWHEEMRFRPPPPPEATVLTLWARRVMPQRGLTSGDSVWRGFGPQGDEVFTVEIPLPD